MSKTYAEQSIQSCKPSISVHRLSQDQRLCEHLLCQPTPIYGIYLCKHKNREPKERAMILTERERRGKVKPHPSYCIVTVLPMSANLRSSKIKKLCFSAIFNWIKAHISYISSSYFQLTKTYL